MYNDIYRPLYTTRYKDACIPVNMEVFNRTGRELMLSIAVHILVLGAVVVFGHNLGRSGDAVVVYLTDEAPGGSPGPQLKPAGSPGAGPFGAGQHSRSIGAIRHRRHRQRAGFRRRRPRRGYRARQRKRHGDGAYEYQIPAGAFCIHS